jgi:hypothetical protein
MRVPVYFDILADRLVIKAMNVVMCDSDASSPRISVRLLGQHLAAATPV